MQGSLRKQDRFGWVDFAKGFCIVAVVAMWVVGTMQEHVAGTPAGWLGYFVSFAKPFRMPDFFLISGLFLSRVIDRPWRHYLDTKVVHYLYFFVLWTFLTVPVTWLLGHETPTSATEALTSLLYLLYSPFQNLWFIMMLSVYFVATRLLRQVPVWIVMPAALLLMVFPLSTGIYHVDRFGVYFGFFYAGHVFANRFFALADWTSEHRKVATAGLLVWAICNGAAVKLRLNDGFTANMIMGFLGISAVVVLSQLVAAQRWASGINYLGKNSIVVYLGFYLPMIIIVPALKASPVGAQLHVVGTVALVGCIGISVLAYHLANRVGLSFLYKRPAWISLVKPTRPLGEHSKSRLGEV